MNLKTQGLTSHVGSAPSPPKVGTVWHTTAFTGVVPGKNTCFEFNPTSEMNNIGITTLTKYFGSGVVEGPCLQDTSYGGSYFVLATNCLLTGGSNTPYQGSFPSSPPPPPGQISLQSLLSNVKYRIWMQPTQQPVPGTKYAGRRLLGGVQTSGSDQAGPGKTVMFMYEVGTTVCGQFTIPFNEAYAQTHFALNEYFNIGQCQDHGFYTLLSENGKPLVEQFTSGWGKGSSYQVWVKNAVCGNIPDYTPNRYTV